MKKFINEKANANKKANANDEKNFYDAQQEKANKNADDLNENFLNFAYRLILEDAIMELSEKQQNIIHAYYFEGDTTLGSIAEKLNMSKASAEKEHQRALKKLKDLLK